VFSKIVNRILMLLNLEEFCIAGIWYRRYTWIHEADVSRRMAIIQIGWATQEELGMSHSQTEE
jgi:hypothetical protein